MPGPVEEKVVGHWSASHLRGSLGGKAGGTLQLTNRRLVFEPYRAHRGRTTRAPAVAGEV